MAIRKHIIMIVKMSQRYAGSPRKFQLVIEESIFYLVCFAAGSARVHSKQTRRRISRPHR